MARLTSRPFSHILGLGGLDALQVDLLHSLQLVVGLRVAASALAKVAEPVIFVKIEFRALQVLVDIFTEHLFELIVTGPLLGVCPLGVTHGVEVLGAVTVL